MANVLTNLVPSLYAGLDIVSRELCGFIPASNRDGKGAEKAAVGQTVYFPIAPVLAAATPAPLETTPAPGAFTMGSDSLTLDKNRACRFYLEGEESRSADNAGVLNVYVRDLAAQAFRTLTAEIEADLAALYKYASRITRPAAGHTFDATDGISRVAMARRILADNGAPNTDMHMVMNPEWAAAIRSQTSLIKANEAGSDALLRQGTLGRLIGFDLHESGSITDHTKGTVTGTDVNNGAGYNIGDVTVTVHGSDAGTLAAGDGIVWTGLAHEYIVRSAVGSGAAVTSITFNKPGLRTALPDTTEATVGASYSPIMCFSRSAVTLITRAPAMPKGGDAGEHTVIVDPVSGLAFDVAIYRQYRRTTMEIAIVWGAKCTKPEHLCLIAGQ
jgi:hypothetical protein